MVRMIHKAKGVDSNGKLRIETALDGTIPEVDQTTIIDIKVSIIVVVVTSLLEMEAGHKTIFQILAASQLNLARRKVEVHFEPVINEHYSLTAATPARRMPLVSGRKFPLATCWVSSFIVQTR